VKFHIVVSFSCVRSREVACPDPDERLIMRIERIGERRMRADELT
jgi:hypothetical protein